MKQINVALLKKVKRHILAEPKRINMYSWRTKLRNRAGEWIEHWVINTKYTARTVPSCGTVACIAGWADMLEGKPAKSICGIHGSARRKLRISEDSARRLFLPVLWPLDLQMMLMNEVKPATKAYAAVVAERIDRFIAEHQGVTK